MSLDYPPTLPNPTRVLHSPKRRVSESDIPGPASYSRREADYVGTMDVEFFLNDIQAALFYSWWKDDLIYGGCWFNCSWPAMRPGRLVCQFKTEPVLTHVFNGAYRYSAQVQVRGASEDVTVPTYTSWIYPAVVEDELSVVGAFVSGVMIQWPIENLDVTGSFTSGVLTAVQQNYTFWPFEAADVTGAFTSGVLTTVQQNYTFWPFEATDVTGAFTSGTLTVVQITYNFWPDESMDVTGAFISGVLT